MTFEDQENLGLRFKLVSHGTFIYSSWI